MSGDGIFALLSRGASLHKCKDSLATPFFHRTAIVSPQKPTPGSTPAVSSDAKSGFIGGTADKGNKIPSDVPGTERAIQLREKHSIFVFGEGDIPCPFERFDDEVCTAHSGINKGGFHTNSARTSQEGKIDGGGERRWRLPRWLIARLQQLGFSSPTAIQMQVCISCPVESR